MRVPSKLLTCVVLALSGCAQMNNTEKGAVIGGASGAGIGAIVGHQFGKQSGAGALIGGLVGTAGGALAGNAKDQRERADKYAAQAAYERGARYAEQRAITNRDVIDMTQKGVNEQHILTMMRTRGSRFDTSPQAIIALQQQGVSDAVLQAMIEQESR